MEKYPRFKFDGSSVKNWQKKSNKGACDYKYGTAGGGGLTSIGNDCLFMAGCHVAHDAIINNKVIVANCGAIAGHVYRG